MWYKTGWDRDKESSSQYRTKIQLLAFHDSFNRVCVEVYLLITEIAMNTHTIILQKNMWWEQLGQRIFPNIHANTGNHIERHEWDTAVKNAVLF